MKTYIRRFPKKKNVTLTMKVEEARQVFYHLKDSPCDRADWEPTVKKAAAKMGQSLQRADEQTAHADKINLQRQAMTKI